MRYFHTDTELRSKEKIVISGVELDQDLFPNLKRFWQENPKQLENSLKAIMEQEMYLSPINAMMTLEVENRLY